MERETDVPCLLRPEYVPIKEFYLTSIIYSPLFYLDWGEVISLWSLSDSHSSAPVTLAFYYSK